MECNLKTARLAMGLTQSELAKKAHVSRGTISALENNTARATTSKTLVNIARALETTVDRLFLFNAFN